MKKGVTITICAILCALLMFALPSKAETIRREYANVVIFAYFAEGNPDDYFSYSSTFPELVRMRALKDNEFFQDSAVSQAFMDMYNGDGDCKMTNYLNKVSDGNFILHNEFPQLKDGVIEPYCITSVTLQQALTENCDDQIVTEIVNHVELPDGTYDYNGDGIIDNLTIVMRGGKGTSGSGGAVPTLYAHKADYSGSGTVSWGSQNLNISSLNMLNTYSVIEDYSSSRQGVLIHEFMHSIGFPDLYTVNDYEYPVYTWDIMASSRQYPSLPLMYMRMKVGHWMSEDSFPVIESTTTSVTLDRADGNSGTRACIIKSPYNDQEIFVAEFRKRPSEKTLDYYIGGSGLIVYRINPNAENFSNHRGDDQPLGVYVIQPQPGQDKYDASWWADNAAANAYLSRESGWTTLGTDDMSKTLADGAIAFSDETNSGIVISNVSSAAGDQITFDVTLPVLEENTQWENAGFTDPSSSTEQKNVAIQTWNGVPHMAVYEDGRISLYSCSGQTWSQVGSPISCSYLSSMRLCVYNGDLYLAYDADGYIVTVKKMAQGTTAWSSVASKEASYFDMQVGDDGVYLTYLVADSSGMNFNAVLGKVNGNQIDQLCIYQSGFLGVTQVANCGGTMYMSVRNASWGSDEISVYRYQNGAATKVSDGTLKANTYSMASRGGKIYVTLSGSQTTLNLNIYDGTSWTNKDSGEACFDSRMVVSQGNLYILLLPNDNGAIRIVRYDAENNQFVEEGINVAGYSQAIDFTSANDTLYVAYVEKSSNTIGVKEKKNLTSWTGAKSYGKSMSLSGDIGIYFYMYLSQEVLDDPNAYMKFRVDGQEQVVKVSEARKSTANGSDIYGFLCKIKSTQMETEIRAIMYNSANEQVSDEIVYTAQTYINRGMASTDVNFANLAKALNNYGKYAKAYFSNTTIPEEADVAAVTVDDTEPYKLVASGTCPEGLHPYGSSLEMASTMQIRHYFTIDAGHSPAEYDVMINGMKCELQKNGNYYIALVPDIKSYDIGTPYTLTVGDYSRTYSGMSYGYRVLSDNTTAANLKSLMKSVSLYYQAAKVYFKK